VQLFGASLHQGKEVIRTVMTSRNRELNRELKGEQPLLNLFAAISILMSIRNFSLMLGNKKVYRKNETEMIKLLENVIVTKKTVIDLTSED
jgi:hypothetical protein